MKSRTTRELEGNLRERDNASRADRAKRLAELMLLGEPLEGRMLFGDCADAFYEAQWSYIDARYLCTILAAQACLEKLLSGFIELADLGQAETSYARLLKSAAAKRLLSRGEYELFDRLRQSRNPHAHYRGANDPGHPMRRAIATGEPCDLLLHRDAQAAVGALVNLVNRPPFALGRPVALFSGEDLLPPVHPAQMSLTAAKP